VEFWEGDFLADLLREVGPITRVDHNTTLRLKGRFARVCVNIDITRPLPRSLTITNCGLSTRVPLIYEGLNEVCPLCGGHSHQLEACPNLPMAKKVEVLVERFDAQGVSLANKVVGSSSAGPSQPLDTWVTVTPKKHMRAIQHPKGAFSTGPAPSFKPSTVSQTPPSAIATSSLSPTFNPAPFHVDGIILAHTAAVVPFGDVPVLNSDLLVSHPDALMEGMEEDTNVDLFLNLNNGEDIEMSTDSAKRKREKDGEEVSSQAPAV